MSWQLCTPLYHVHKNDDFFQWLLTGFVLCNGYISVIGFLLSLSAVIVVMDHELLWHFRVVILSLERTHTAQSGGLGRLVRSRPILAGQKMVSKSGRTDFLASKTDQQDTPNNVIVHSKSAMLWWAKMGYFDWPLSWPSPSDFPSYDIQNMASIHVKNISKTIILLFISHRLFGMCQNYL